MKNIFLTLFIFLLIGCSGSNSTKKVSSDGKPTIIRFESSDLYETIGGVQSMVPKYNKNGPRYLFRVLKNEPYDEDGYQFQQEMAKQDEYGNYTTWYSNVGKKFIVSNAFYDEVQKFNNIKYITGATMEDLMNNTAVAQTEIGKTLYNIVESCGKDDLWWFLGDENSNSRDCIVKMPGEVFSYSDNTIIGSSQNEIDDLISNNPGIKLDEKFFNDQGKFDVVKFRKYVNVLKENTEDGEKWTDGVMFLVDKKIWTRKLNHYLKEQDLLSSFSDSDVCENNKIEESKYKYQKTPSEQRRVSHILISYKGAIGALPTVLRSRNEAKKEANNILKSLNSNPNNFNCLAFQYSDDTSNTQGGDIGYISEGVMVKDFSDFVFTNEVGSIGIVETDFGFHIIYITEV